MSTLSDQLKNLGVKVGKAGLTKTPKRKFPIEALVDGQLIETAYGETFVVEKLYPLDHQQGNGRLAFDAPLEMLATWARDETIAEYVPENFVFLDTETTGLAAGSGTYAFMIGVGRFEADGFRLVQFFLRDPIEEPALLAGLKDFLAPAKSLVTFNGKAFDIPLLNARYITNASPTPLQDMAHVDMLHLARRLWKNRLSSCTLVHLEEQILAETRTADDVPGWMIPALYMDYIRSGDGRELAGVFYHNAMDILSMAALTNQAAHMLANPLNGQVEHGEDLASLGLLFEDLGQIEIATETMQKSLAMQLPTELQQRTLMRLSRLYKRQANHSTAISLWWQAAADREIYAHEELAKYYEHREHNFNEAIQWCHAAMAILKSGEVARHERLFWEPEFKHRLARLLGKIDRSSNN